MTVALVLPIRHWGIFGLLGLGIPNSISIAYRAFFRNWLMGKSMSFTRHFARDQDGAVLVETTVLIPILLVFLLGAVDFLIAFYQWSAAAKAVEVGARIAAVSDPVANGLNSLSTSFTVPSAGDPMPSFQVTCDGAASHRLALAQARYLSWDGNF